MASQEEEDGPDVVPDEEVSSGTSRKPRKPPVIFTDKLKLLLANTITQSYSAYGICLVPGSHNKTEKLHDLVVLINGHLKREHPEKNLEVTANTVSRWISKCITDVDKWQAQIDQETKDGGDKETGADDKDTAEFKAAWLELMANHKIAQENAPAKKAKTSSGATSSTGAASSSGAATSSGAVAGPMNEVRRSVSTVVDGARSLQESAEQEIAERKGNAIAAGQYNYKSPSKPPDPMHEVLAMVQSHLASSNTLAVAMARDVSESAQRAKIERMEMYARLLSTAINEAEQQRYTVLIQQIQEELIGSNNANNAGAAGGPHSF